MSLKVIFIVRTIYIITLTAPDKARSLFQDNLDVMTLVLSTFLL